MPKVNVPQKDGTITIAGGPETYSVTDGTVEVKKDDVEYFLANVAGSSVADSSKK